MTDLLADNIIYLKKSYPHVYQSIKAWENNGDVSVCDVETAKDGNLTLRCNIENQTVFIHSKYNPIREAKTIIDSFAEKENIDEDTFVLFYGLGLGYHIEYFCSNYPNIKFSIIEPSVEIMHFFTDTRLLKRFTLKQMESIKLGFRAEEMINEVLWNKDKRIAICELPVYSKIFKDEYELFLKLFRERIKEERSSLNVNYAFKQRWILNSVNNFKYVLRTPNVLMNNSARFKDKKAILISAGPSLDFEIDNLKKIKNQGSAYIFCVGSAINTLIANDLFPHAMCTYDPSDINQFVFEKVNEAKIDTIPMIFGSSVGYETLQQYAGPKCHMITSQDTISGYFLKANSDDKIPMVQDASSIAIVTLELLMKLHFSDIILVGQNLAYLKNKSYADGSVSEVIKADRDRDAQTDRLTVEDVDGNEIETTESLMRFKRQLEMYISLNHLKVFNTTIGGARIEGTVFKNLSEFVLNEGSDGDNGQGIWVEQLDADIYSRAYLNKQKDNLLRQYERYTELLKEINLHIRRLKELVSNKNNSQVQRIQREMDILIKEMEKNDFFRIIVLPIYRVEYGVLCNEVSKIRLESSEEAQARMRIKPTEKFILLLHASGELFKNVYDVINNTIERYSSGEDL